MKTISVLFLFMVLGTAAYSQQDSTSETETPRTTFTIGAQYANNSNYYGQRPVDATPYTAMVGSLRFPSGIYFTGMAYRLLKGKSAAVDAGSIGAGIDFKIGQNWTGDISFSHALYGSNSPFLQASLNNTASATITYNWWMSTSVTTDYSFGSDRDAFATLGSSKMITLGSLFSPKDGVSLNPELSVTAGSQHYYQTYVTKKILSDSIAGLPIPIFGSESQYDTSSTRSTSFKLLAYSLRVPLSYYRAHYQLEAAAQFSMPAQAAKINASAINSFFTLSFYYQF